MSHHGDEPFPFDGPEFQRRQKLMRGLLDTTGFVGALGQFPQGQLNKSDEGAIRFMVGDEGGKVVIDFGTSVRWMGMTPQEAVDLASAIFKRARHVARQNGETVAFTLGI